MNVFYAIRRHAFLPLCRAYSRTFLGDKRADLPMRMLSGLYFYSMHGYWPNLCAPRSFSEKVWHRMLFDRRAQWTTLSDKLAVRDYIANRVGDQHLVPLLWSGQDPDDIPFDSLPQQFVLKATHGCGYNILVRNKAELDQVAARRTFRKWLQQNYCHSNLFGMEWGYKNARPRIVVEAFLGDNGIPPTDYKLFCFHGRTEFIQMNIDRFSDHTERYFGRDFSMVELDQGQKLFRGAIARPKNFDEMVRVAETLASEFDFIRIDLYTWRNHVYVGELTCYPSAGITKFNPREFDFTLGGKWKLTPLIGPKAGSPPGFLFTKSGLV